MRKHEREKKKKKKGESLSDSIDIGSNGTTVENFRTRLRLVDRLLVT